MFTIFHRYLKKKKDRCQPCYKGKNGIYVWSFCFSFFFFLSCRLPFITQWSEGVMVHSDYHRGVSGACAWGKFRSTYEQGKREREIFNEREWVREREREREIVKDRVKVREREREWERDIWSKEYVSSFKYSNLWRMYYFAIPKVLFQFSLFLFLFLFFVFVLFCFYVLSFFLSFSFQVTKYVSSLNGNLYDSQGRHVIAKQIPERVSRMRKNFYFLPHYPSAGISM